MPPEYEDSSDPLEKFLDGLLKKVGPDVGLISSQEELEEAKLAIAREFGLEEEYQNQEFKALCKVSTCYDEMKENGQIEEAPDFVDQKSSFFERINAHFDPNRESPYEKLGS